MLLIRENVVIDHTTLSTNALRRAKEAFKLYVEGDVSPLSFPDIAAVLQAQMRSAFSILLYLHQFTGSIYNDYVEL